MDFPFALMALFDNQLKNLEREIEEATNMGPVLAVEATVDVFGFTVAASTFLFDDELTWTIDGAQGASRECISARLAEEFRVNSITIPQLNAFAQRLNTPGALHAQIKVLAFGIGT